MNHFVVSAQGTALASLLAIVCALVQRPQQRIHRVFAVYWGSMALWSFCVGWQFQLLKRIPDELWGWLLHLGCVFIPFCLFHFAVELAGPTPHRQKALWVGYGLGIIFTLFNVLTEVFTTGTSYRDAYAYPTPATFYGVYFAAFWIFAAWATVLLFQARARMSSTLKPAYLVYFLLHCLAYTGGLDNFLIMWDLRIFPWYPYGLYPDVVHALAAAYLVTRPEFPGRP